MKFERIILISLAPVGIAGLFLFFLIVAIGRSIYLPIIAVKIWFAASEEGDRKHKDMWLGCLEQYQRSWLERHRRVDLYLQRVDWHLCNDRLIKFPSVAHTAFEDVSTWHI